ncbi:glycosyltransferase [Candidatus Pacearchaeota archaeon]|nr:glycosyltransferase [Candidatus Pacearchaeota archaeon]MBD3283264.1 glycosyltransferase [Candidatus Pacearchaeota archaeon]
MKALVFYAYPIEADGQSIQGDMLFKGLLNNNVNVKPCHYIESLQKTNYLKNWKPDVAFGIGYWGNVPEIVREPLKHKVTPVPWFNADGWVANYQKDFNDLDLMFTTSDWVRSIYKRDGVDVSKIVPVHIGVDTDLFRPLSDDLNRKKLRRMLGVNDNEKMIMTIGGDVTSKGAQEMLRALAEVNKEFKNWKYVCKSWPSECSAMWREKEENLVNELGLEDNVIFMDDMFSPEFMVDMLNACDVYAAPSRIEGFGMIQVEAMACGKPVISINKMGPSETILHNKTGLLAGAGEEVVLNQEWAWPSMGFSRKKLVKFNEPKVFGYRADVNDLREHALKILTEDELAEKMGKQARRHAVRNFDYRVISKKMLDVTREKLGFGQEELLTVKQPVLRKKI